MLDLSGFRSTKSWRLNERHYGALQGLNKAETAAKHGEAQVKIWRRSYDIPPPPLDPETSGTLRTIRGTLARPEDLPRTESLKDTVDRFMPYWHATIAPAIRSGKRVFIAAHGNSLRALVKYLDHVSESDIVELNIPTGIPLVYELDDELQADPTLLPGGSGEVAAAAARVASQGGRKKNGRLARGGPARGGVLSVSFRLFDFFRSFIGGNPQRSQESPIVGGHLECPPGRGVPGRASRRRPPSPARHLRTVHESNHGFERHLHLETRGARLLTARFDLGVFRDRARDRVGQLAREPVDDVVHPRSSPTPPGRVPVRFPIEPVYTGR